MLMFVASSSVPATRTRAPYAGAVEDCQVGGATEYVGAAPLPERCLQLPVALDKDDDGRGGTEVFEHRVRVSAEATNDHVVTNSLVDLCHVTARPLWSAEQSLNKSIAARLGNPGRYQVRYPSWRRLCGKRTLLSP